MNFEFTRRAQKDMLKLPKDIRKKVFEKIETAIKNQKFEQLTDSEFKKLRIGNYRVIAIDDGKKLTIHRIGHRKNIYKKL